MKIAQVALRYQVSPLFLAHISLCHHKEILQSRPQDCPPGSLRFNTDSAHLEYFKGDTIGWVEVEATNDELGGGTGSNTGLGVRGLFAGGFISPTGTARTNIIDFHYYLNFRKRSRFW